MDISIGWIFAFSILGIWVAAILSGTFGAWLKYRYRRAALETLKAYAANGRDPPEGLISALTPMGRRHGRSWGTDPNSWGMEAPFDGEVSPEDEDDIAELRRGKERFVARAHRRRHYRRSPEHAWRQAIFWGALTTGFGLAANYVATGEARNSLTIVAIILGALTVAATLGALLTTVARASDRKAD